MSALTRSQLRGQALPTLDVKKVANILRIKVKKNLRREREGEEEGKRW